MFTADTIAEGLEFCNDTLSPPNTYPDCNDAPTYVEVFPVSGAHNGKNDLVWIQYNLFYGYSAYDSSSPINGEHTGDWEHLCILASLDDLGAKTAFPVDMHFHSHGGYERSSTAYSWHSDHRCETHGLSHSACYGTRHPRVFVEAWGHGMHDSPGWSPVLGNPHNGGYGPADDTLNNPMYFMSEHRASPYYLNGIFNGFDGEWGHIGGSPKGPLNFNGACDHDWWPDQFGNPQVTVDVSYWLVCG